MPKLRGNTKIQASAKQIMMDRVFQKKDFLVHIVVTLASFAHHLPS